VGRGQAARLPAGHLLLPPYSEHCNHSETNTTNQKCQSRPELPLGDSNRGLLPLSGNARLAKARGQAWPGSHTTCNLLWAHQEPSRSCRNLLASVQSCSCESSALMCTSHIPEPAEPAKPQRTCWVRLLAVQSGEHPHPPVPKPPRCRSLGLFSRGRAWAKGCCSFPLLFHLRQGLSNSMCERRHRCSTHRITESQNGRGWKGPLWVIQPNPPAKAGSPRAGCTGLRPGGS